MARSKPSEPGSDEVRLAEFRLEMGWTAYVATKWLERGMPVVRKPRFRGDDHIISRKAVTRWLFDELERTSVAATPRPALDDDGKPIVFGAERARLTKEQADRLARERLEDERELVRRGPLEAALAAQDQALKDRLLMVPLTGAAEALAAGSAAGAPGIAGVYERHINRALADVASADLVSAAAH